VIRTIEKQVDHRLRTRHKGEKSESEDSTNMAVKVSLVNVGKDLWTYLCRHTPPPLAISNLANEGQLTDILNEGHIDEYFGV